MDKYINIHHEHKDIIHKDKTYITNIKTNGHKDKYINIHHGHKDKYIKNIEINT